MFLIYLEEKSLLPDSTYRKNFLSSLVLIYNYLIMAFWSIGIFWYFITHIDKKLYIPDILWAYAVSTFVWNIMALREVSVGQNGVIVTLSYYQIACLGLAVYTYYNFGTISFIFMCSYFGVLMVLSLLTSAFLYRNASMEKSRL